MDPQLEARYLGLGLLMDSLAVSMGSYRTLAIQQTKQLQEMQARIDTLEKAQATPAVPPAT
jgi:hypothetical protein